MKKDGDRLSCLLITPGFYPAVKYGGPVTSLVNFVHALSRDIDVHVLTLNNDFKSGEQLVDCPGQWMDFGNARVMYLPGKDFSHRTVWELYSSVEADFIYLNGYYSASVSMPTIIACRRHSIPLLMAFRGELLPGAVSQKRLKKLLFICMTRHLFKREWVFQATSEAEVQAICHRIGCARDRVALLENFPALYDGYKRGKSKTPGSLSLIYMARIHPGKNLFVALKALSKVRGSIAFNIYGPVEDESYWRDCSELMRQMPQEIRIEYRGICHGSCIESAYEHSQAMILPTRTENYGQTIVESMLCGCPVVISDRTPWNEINDYRSGWAIPLTEEESFTAALQALVDMDQSEYDELLEHNRQFVESHFEEQMLKDRYMQVFDRLRWGMNA